MHVTATLTRDWKKRWLMIVGFFAAGALWFYYDGFIAYPKMAERYAEFEKVAAEAMASTGADEVDDPKVLKVWEEYALERGWSWEKPKNKDADDFSQQKNLGTVLLVISIGLLGWYRVSQNQKVTFDGKIITDPRGREVEADSVFELDRRKWENKGIVYARYEVGGKKKKLTLDDFKFGGCEDIINELDRRLSGGDPDSTKDT